MASYDPHRRPAHRERKARRDRLAPVGTPLETTDATTHPARSARPAAELAISSRGVGVFNPPFGAPPTDSYAAIYEHAKARLSSVAEVTVIADRAGGVSGGAGLIERDDMTASKRTRAGGGAVRERATRRS